MNPDTNISWETETCPAGDLREGDRILLEGTAVDVTSDAETERRTGKVIVWTPHQRLRLPRHTSVQKITREIRDQDLERIRVEALQTATQLVEAIDVIKGGVTPDEPMDVIQGMARQIVETLNQENEDV